MREEDEDRDRHDRYWRSNLLLIAGLLVVWFLVSFVCGIFLVETLNRYRIGSLPLGFWFAQQGSIYVFVLLIFAYAWGMDYLGERHGTNRDEEGENP